MIQRPPMGDFAAWQVYWREEGDRNRAKVDRAGELIKALKVCTNDEFDAFARELKHLSASAGDVIAAIQDGRANGKYDGTSKGEKQWKQK